MRPVRTSLPFALLAASAFASAAPAQPDSVTVVAGERYRAGGLHRALWGSNYRDVWATPVRVEVMDPDTFAGGLVPLRTGGDFASSTLHLRGRDGRRYVFRSVDKNTGQGLGPELAGTVVSWVVQDQVSASHPAAPTLAAPLLAAAGVLHPSPRLVVMADRPSLAGCRERFAGMLGHIEERADENEAGEGADDEEEPDPRGCGAGDDPAPGGPAFAGADAVTGTEGFLDDLEEDPRNRIDARAYLAARLVDVLLGDWDRHEDQWRWARFDSGGVRVWRPVPRDRDHVAVSHEGLMLALGRPLFLRMVRFDRELPSLRGITVQAEPLDRRLLASLPREAWAETAEEVRARVTDAAIDSAVAALPPEYRARSGPALAAKLRARRDEIPTFAARWYATLARNVDVRTTDADETATIDRLPDGSVEVAVAAGDVPVYRRRFLPHETDDVRLYLLGGDDRVVVRGAGRGVGVRVVGGGGDDVLVDSSASPGVAFYDHRGENVFARAPGTRVSTRAWTAPVDSSTLAGERTSREHGWSGSAFAPWVDWRRAGPVLGGGPRFTKYGFRRLPHHYQLGARAGWAPLETRFAVEAFGDLRPENRPHWFSAGAYASDLDNLRFHGFGNATPAPQLPEVNDVWLRRLHAAARVHLPLGARAALALGPVAQWTEAEVAPGSPLEAERPAGTGAVTQLGADAVLRADGRDAPGFPRRGWRLDARGSAYPLAWGDADAFGAAEATAAAYLWAGAGPVLAVRAGGRRAWGGFPVWEAALLGGGSTVRGHTGQRFAGDALLFGGAELRQPLFRANPGVRGTLGVFALADAGRVWFEGASEGDWHTAVGGGAFFHALGQSVHAAVVRGERTTVHLGLGMPF